MHTANLRKLIQTIEQSESFDMQYYFHSCGTPACIAGHAAMHARLIAKPRWFSATEDACAWLDLTDDVADDLFLPLLHELGLKFSDITKEQAVACLKHLELTGNVVWETT